MVLKNFFVVRAIAVLFSFALFPKAVPAQTENHHQLSVNFISIGSGIDSKATGQLAEFVKDFEKQNNLVLDYKIQPWGKEGEQEYLLNLEKLKSGKRKAFTNSVCEMFKDNKLVKVEYCE